MGQAMPYGFVLLGYIMRQNLHAFISIKVSLLVWTSMSQFGNYGQQLKHIRVMVFSEFDAPRFRGLMQLESHDDASPAIAEHIPYVEVVSPNPRERLISGGDEPS